MIRNSLLVVLGSCFPEFFFFFSLELDFRRDSDGILPLINEIAIKSNGMRKREKVNSTGYKTKLENNILMLFIKDLSFSIKSKKSLLQFVIHIPHIPGPRYHSVCCSLPVLGQIVHSKLHRLLWLSWGSL